MQRKRNALEVASPNNISTPSDTRFWECATQTESFEKKKEKKMGENEVLYGLGCQVGGVNMLATLSDLPVGQLVSLPGICKHA